MKHPRTGAPLVRDTRPVRIASFRYPGYYEVVELSGWWSDEDDYPMLSDDADWAIYDAAIERMRVASAKRIGFTPPDPIPDNGIDGQ